MPLSEDASGPQTDSISISLQVLREYETIAYWRKSENLPPGIAANIRPVPNRALGYGVFLSNESGKTFLAQTFGKSALIPTQDFRQFSQTGTASRRIRVLASAIKVVRNDMLTDCKLLAGDLENNLKQVGDALFAELDTAGIRLFGAPQSHFEHRVNVGLTAFLTSLSIREDPDDVVTREMWNRVVEHVENLYHTLQDFEDAETQPLLFNIDGAPTLYEAMLYTISTLTLELLPKTGVVKRCLSHLPMQSLQKLPSDAVPLPEALRDSYTRVKFPFLGLNARSAVTKWSGEYVNDDGAVNPIDGKCYELDPRKIFLVNATSCYEMDVMLGKYPEQTDSNGLCIALICATDVLSRPRQERAVGNLAVCIAGNAELTPQYESGHATIANVAVEWKDFKLVGDQAQGYSGVMAEYVGEIIEVWTAFLHRIATERAILGKPNGEERQMREVQPQSVMHYQNMNLFRPLRGTVNTNLGLTAEPPKGGHLLDCEAGGNYLRDRNGRKRYVVRNGDQLKLVKRWAHRVLYYVSRVCIEAGEYKVKVQMEDILINQHTSTAQLLKIMLDVGQDHWSAKYALKFIEDSDMKFDCRSACFVPLHANQVGPKLSAVLGADLLSSVDCLVKAATGEVFVLIGVRLLKVQRVGPGALHATEVPRDSSLRRCRIAFDSVLGTRSK